MHQRRCMVGEEGADLVFKWRGGVSWEKCWVEAVTARKILVCVYR